MVQEAVSKLVQYGLAAGLLEKEDAVAAANALIERLGIDVLEDDAWEKIDRFDPADQSVIADLPQILEEL